MRRVGVYDFRGDGSGIVMVELSTLLDGEGVREGEGTALRRGHFDIIRGTQGGSGYGIIIQGMDGWKASEGRIRIRELELFPRKIRCFMVLTVKNYT